MKFWQRVCVVGACVWCLMGVAYAQTPAQLADLMRETGWSEADALAWGQRYYGWGQPPRPQDPCAGPPSPYRDPSCQVPMPPPQGAPAGCVELPNGPLCVTVNDCVLLSNPYAHGPQQVACAHLARVKEMGLTAPPTFVPGQLYEMRTPYVSYRMRVVAVSRASDGVDVITCEWADMPARMPFAFRNTLANADSGFASPWWWSPVF